MAIFFQQHFFLPSPSFGVYPFQDGLPRTNEIRSNSIRSHKTIHIVYLVAPSGECIIK